MAFSISACTRVPRPGEVHGKDYYFLQEEDFKTRIGNDEFVEWEMVYTGKYYGTLKSELDRIWGEERAPLVDIDVLGALSVKAKYPLRSLSLFIKAPSLEELKKRLVARGTESEESLAERLDKAAYELGFADKFDALVVNDDLEEAIREAGSIIKRFLCQDGH